MTSKSTSKALEVYEIVSTNELLTLVIAKNVSAHFTNRIVPIFH